VLASRFSEEVGGTYEMDGKPLLVVHGRSDAIVPFETGEAVYRAARPPKVLVALEDGLHHEEVEDGSGPQPAVVDATVAFWDVFLRGDRGARDRLLAQRAGTTVRSEGVA
jgi:fermentation-respiration switch protein FrsA (DUF1100 family)